MAEVCKRCAARAVAGLRDEAGQPIIDLLTEALTGWYQCSQFGADTHRADPSQPACDFQTSTA